MVKSYLIGGALVAAALAASALPAAAADTAPARSCFFSSQWQGWSSPSPRILYLKVNMHDVYRVDLASDARSLRWPSNHLISVVRGSNSVCSALDLDLKVSDGHGFVEPLFPRTLTKLTREEAAAIPKKYQP